MIPVWALSVQPEFTPCMFLSPCIQRGLLLCFHSIDLALPLNGSIDTTSPSWATNILDQYLETINVFSKYDNVLAYNVGNEVILSGETAVAAYIKAAARDVKAYL